MLAPGSARGRALVLAEPLSLWGGLDPVSGEVVDPRHAQRGTPIAGRVLVMRETRGSSSSSSVLAEAVRAGVGPAAILLAAPDLILAVGSAVAAELYGTRVPIVVLAEADLERVVDGDELIVSDDGTVAPA